MPEPRQLLSLQSALEIAICRLRDGCDEEELEAAQVLDALAITPEGTAVQPGQKLNPGENTMLDKTEMRDALQDSLSRQDTTLRVIHSTRDRIVADFAQLVELANRLHSETAGALKAVDSELSQNAGLEKYIALACSRWASDGEIEIDQGALVSIGDEENPRGAYVQAWVWVDNPEYKEEDDA